MDPQDWLNSVATDLYRYGLPEDYVRRTCDELADHAQECGRAGKVFDTFDQPPVDFCTPLVKNYRRRTLVGRLPLVCCLIAPLVLAVAVPLAYFILAGLILEGIFGSFSETGGKAPVESSTIWATFYLGTLLVPLLCINFVNALNRRMMRSWGWSAAMFVLLFCGTMSVCTTLQMKRDGTDLSLIVAFPSGVDNFCHWGQCLMVVAIGYVIVRRQWQSQRKQSIVVTE
jgi:hypothetical protein